MLNPIRHWIVTADSRQATVFSCHLAPGARPHVEQHGRIENDHEGEHQHHRPDQLGGGERRGALGRSGASAAPHSVAPGHGAEEEQRRFAREVARWLSAMEDVWPHTVTVYAASRFLGLLREEANGRRITTDLREGELTHLRPGELADHAAVRDLLGVGA